MYGGIRACRRSWYWIGGSEFDSIYFETLLARFEITKKSRPPAKARFGSTCERIFGTANKQFLHNLQGNTQAARERQVTKQRGSP